MGLLQLPTQVFFINRQLLVSLLQSHHLQFFVSALRDLLLQLAPQSNNLALKVGSVLFASFEVSLILELLGLDTAVEGGLVPFGVWGQLAQQMSSFVFGVGPQLAQLIVDLFAEVGLGLIFHNVNQIFKINPHKIFTITAPSIPTSNAPPSTKNSSAYCSSFPADL